MLVYFKKDIPSEVNPKHIFMVREIGDDVIITLGNGNIIKLSAELNHHLVEHFEQWCMEKELSIHTDDSIEDSLSRIGDYIMDIMKGIFAIKDIFDDANTITSELEDVNCALQNVIEAIDNISSSINMSIYEEEK